MKVTAGLMDLLTRCASFPSDRKLYTSLPMFPALRLWLLMALIRSLLTRRTNTPWNGHLPKVRFVAHIEASKKGRSSFGRKAGASCSEDKDYFEKTEMPPAAYMLLFDTTICVTTAETSSGHVLFSPLFSPERVSSQILPYPSVRNLLE